MSNTLMSTAESICAYVVSQHGALFAKAQSISAFKKKGTLLKFFSHPFFKAVYMRP